jgi:hypothetical protein
MLAFASTIAWSEVNGLNRDIEGREEMTSPVLSPELQCLVSAPNHMYCADLIVGGGSNTVHDQCVCKNRSSGCTSYNNK